MVEKALIAEKAEVRPVVWEKVPISEETEKIGVVNLKLAVRSVGK